MSEVIQLYLALAILITIAKAAGYAATRLGQPAVLGELIAGVIIGPSMIDLLHNQNLFPDGGMIEHVIIDFAEIGVLFLMFMAGLEVNLRSLSQVGRTALTAGTLGVIAPVVIAAITAVIFGYDADAAIFIGLILAATSVSISAQVMLELGVLRTKEGLALLGAAIVDDILVILLMSVFIALRTGGTDTAVEPRPVGEVIIRLVGFLTIAGALSWIGLPWIAKQVNKTSISAGVVMLAVVAALIFGVSAEIIGGAAAITGAFIAGVGLGRADHRIKEKIEHGLYAINYGIFVPLFFISIGLKADLHLITGAILPLAILLTLGAIASKIIGAGAGGLLTGFTRRGSLRLGIGMISRGEVGLIVAALGVTSGIIGEDVLAAVILVVLVTTVVTPPLLRWALKQVDTPPAAPGTPPPPIDPAAVTAAKE